MKNILLTLSSLLFGCVLFFTACDKTEETDSVSQKVSVPFIYASYLEDVYIYGAGNTSIYTDIPDTVGIAIDTVYGFVGGYGGKTGMDTIVLLKSEVLGLTDTISPGSFNFSFQKYTKGNYRVTLSSSVVIAEANNNPGPTALEGVYKRPSNGYLLTLAKVANGIYLLTNPGGAATIPPNPYLLYNYTSSLGQDSLSFAIQTDLCGGGTQLVDPGAPAGLASKKYTSDFPPKITSYAPLTLSWIVYSFPDADPEATNTVVCNWGGAVRIFEKQ